MEPFILDELEPFDKALIRLLYEIPTQWKPISWDDLSDMEIKALHRLIDAGLIEARIELEAWMEGESRGLYVRSRVRGDYRQTLLREAFGRVPEWTTDDGRCRGKTSIKYDITEVRLTDQGELALHDWHSPEESTVLAVVRGYAPHSGGIKESGKVFIEEARREDKKQLAARHDSDAKSARENKVERVKINFMEPWFQGAPGSRAILEMLRNLTDRFQDLSEETTDMDWTAFRALAKAGAAEGIIRFTCTYADADGPSTEYFLVYGEYPSAMPSRPFLTTEPFESVLVKARLTTTGIRWAEYLAIETDQPAERARGFVLHLLWEAKATKGRVQRVPVPESADGQSATPYQSSCESDSHAENASVPKVARDDNGKIQPPQNRDVKTTNEHDSTKRQLDKIMEMLRMICTGALLQVGRCDLKPDEAKKRFEALSPSRRKAWMQWFTAERVLQSCTDSEAYEWNKEHIEADETLVSFETWCRYIRDARKALGLQKYSTDTPTPTGKSVVSADDVEPEYYSRNQ